MHIAKIYSKRHKCAFVVLGHCGSFDQVMLEIDLFQEVTKIRLPNRIKCEEISKMEWQNMTVVKFDLNPATIFEHGGYGDWLMLDDDPGLLEKLQIKPYKREK